MLVDLLSMDNYVNFNIKLAEILGLHPAIYISELLNINEKAVRKEKVANNCFKVVRSYITKRTTLSVQEQKEIDSLLVSIGVLKVNSESSDLLTLDLTMLTSLVSAEPTDVEKLKKLVNTNKPKRRTKAQVIVDQLKTLVVAENEELRQAYFDWIDAVHAKQGWMSAKSVTVGQKTIDAYCNHNLDMALHLLEIASIGGYRDIQWAINTYEKDYKLNYHIPAAPVKARTVSELSEEVF